VAKLIELYGFADAKRLLQEGKEGSFARETHEVQVAG
jgi:hypothetical protein